MSASVLQTCCVVKVAYLPADAASMARALTSFMCRSMVSSRRRRNSAAGRPGTGSSRVRPARPVRVLARPQA